MVRLTILLTFLSCLFLTADAKNIRVQVQTGKSISSVSFTAATSGYTVYSGKRKVLNLKQHESLSIAFTDNLLTMATEKRRYGSFKKLKFVSKNDNAFFLIKPGESDSEATHYYDHLEITARNQSLRLLNVVDIEKYAEGTVAAEAGHNAEPEFYKVQAIISRTYALGHLQRHAEEGFNLCDQVHCQAYKGISRYNKTIADAVMATKNKILVDSLMAIITAAYHSNCGGETSAAEDVWSKSLPYLQPVDDPFCYAGTNARWERQIALTDWIDYLNSKNLLSAFTDVAMICDTTFCYFPVKREALLPLSNAALAMRTIRDDWKFKSAYFSINQSGDILVFNGRGYGHGVGVCQEGAMQMAKFSHSYENIISFYYRDVSIVDADMLNFLNEK